MYIGRQGCIDLQISDELYSMQKSVNNQHETKFSKQKICDLLWQTGTSQRDKFLIIQCKLFLSNSVSRLTLEKLLQKESRVNAPREYCLYCYWWIALCLVPVPGYMHEEQGLYWLGTRAKFGLNLLRPASNWPQLKAAGGNDRPQKMAPTQVTSSNGRVVENILNVAAGRNY